MENAPTIVSPMTNAMIVKKRVFSIDSRPPAGGCAKVAIVLSPQAESG